MIEAIKKHKRIVAAVVILILTAIIEIECNYQAIRHGYTDLDLSEYITEENSLGTEKFVVSYAFPQKNYIKQIKLTGSFPKEQWFKIKVTEVNPFGKEEEKTYSDTVNGWFNDYYTDISANVTSLEIEIDKPKDAQLTGVVCSNNVEINKYRILFFVMAFSMLYLAVFEKKASKKPERFFAVYALIFGMLIIFFAQPVKNSWDEQVHFQNAYRLASGRIVKWTEAAVDIKDVSSVKCNTKAEYAELRKYMDEKGKELLYTEKKETLIPSYTVLAYVPQALFLKIGMLLHLPFSVLYAFGKVGNLILFIGVMYCAISIAKKKKLLLMFFAMMPTVIFQASSYTYDIVVLSFITLACVMWANEMYFLRKGVETWKVIAMVLLFTIGCFSKAVYIPLLLLVILLPEYQKMSNKNKIFLWGGIALIVMLVMMTFVLPTLTSTVARDLSFGGDSRGGDTGSVRQIISMVKHPWASIKLMLGSIIQLDNFRNLGYSSADNYFFGNLMFLNFAEAGILSDKWSVLLVPMFTILAICPEANADPHYKLKLWDKFVIFVSVFGTIFMIWLALYLSFTPVGENEIRGVQARYYLPLIYMLFALLPWNKKCFDFKREKLIRASLCIVQILGWVLMYQTMIQGRLV